MKDTTDEVEAARLLEDNLKNTFTEEMGAPLTSRISLIVPFFSFSPGEQVVVTHKFIVDFGDKMRQPIDLAAKRLIGHIHLHVHNDGQLSRHLAEMGYDENLGARSLQHVLEQQIYAKLTANYLENEVEVTGQTKNGPLQKYVVHLRVTEEDKKDVVIYNEGFTSVMKKGQ